MGSPRLAPGEETGRSPALSSHVPRGGRQSPGQTRAKHGRPDWLFTNRARSNGEYPRRCRAICKAKQVNAVSTLRVSSPYYLLDLPPRQGALRIQSAWFALERGL